MAITETAMDIKEDITDATRPQSKAERMSNRAGYRESISVLFVTYNRIHLLRQSVYSFLATTTYPRAAMELIVCDDGSRCEVQQAIRRLPFDTFLLATQNQGMGANTNKGLRAAKGEFILQMQDDWLCDGRPDFVEAALEAFRERSDIGLIRLWEPCAAPSDEHVTKSGRSVHIYHGRSFQVCSDFPYSDRPHIKRKAFHETLGLYSETLNMPRTELDFCARVDAQTGLRVAWLDGYSVFENLGAEESTNPAVRRARLLRGIEGNPAGRIAVAGVRSIKRSFKHALSLYG